jgi:two-component system sensor histidine kinase KdpD
MTRLAASEPMRWPGGALVAGIAASVALTALLGLLMLPVRAHLGTATSGMVLVIPVVVGVSLGGWVAGVVAVAVGFLAYDFFFIRPYTTLAVSSYTDWITLAVYAAVMLVVARVVFALQQTRAQARRQADDTSQLLEVSDLLIGDKALGELLAVVVETLQHEFRLTSAAVLLPAGGRLSVAALAGEPLPAAVLGDGLATEPPSSRMALAGRAGLRTMPLATAERPIGVLLLSGPALSPSEQRLLTTYANHAALAVERAQLREQALRSRVLAEVDSWRRALLGSVAHDLRTPLASIKAALSDLGDASIVLSPADRHELLATAEDETDRLTRLVTNLLDMYRIDAGTKRLARESVSVAGLVDEAVEAMRGRLNGLPLTVEIESSLHVMVDRALIVRVLVNLLENAVRHTPQGTPVTIRARRGDAWAELQFVDQGPGLPPARLAALFGGAPTTGGVDGTRGQDGVGLAICQAFVSANGGRISAEPGPLGGLQLNLLLPPA